MGTLLEWKCLCSYHPNMIPLGAVCARLGCLPDCLIVLPLGRAQNTRLSPEAPVSPVINLEFRFQGLPQLPTSCGWHQGCQVFTPRGYTIPIIISLDGSPLSHTTHSSVWTPLPQGSLQENFFLPQTLQLETNPKQFFCDQMHSAFPGKFPCTRPFM